VEKRYIIDFMQSLSCTQFSFSIFIDRDRLTTEIDKETDRSSMESFLLAMLSKERNARPFGLEKSKSRSTNFANAYYGAFNRKPVFFIPLPTPGYRVFGMQNRASSPSIE